MRRPWIACIALLAACGSVGADDDAAVVAPATPVPTIAGVGSLPETVPPTDPPATEPLVEITRPVNADGELAELIGDRVGGNRILMIGDSIFAGTETRYGGEMCEGLEPLGWAVEVAAEPGRFVEFGVEVVERIVPAPAVDAADDTATTEDGAPSPAAGPDDWDAAAVFLGSNYNGDQGNYDDKMREILDRLAPRPTLLYTVTLYRSDYAEVNEVIEGLVADYPNVVLIDWAEAAKTPGVLRGDGLHPGDAGEQVLVELTAAALGDAPAGEAECIRSQFRDDSAIRAGNGSPNTGGSSSGGSSSGGGRTTSTSSGSSSSGGGTSGGNTSGSGSTSGGSSTTDPGGSDGTTTDGTTGTTGGTGTDGTGDTTGGTGTDGSGDTTGGTGTDGTGDTTGGPDTGGTTGSGSTTTGSGGSTTGSGSTTTGSGDSTTGSGSTTTGSGGSTTGSGSTTTGSGGSTGEP